jgi:beta-1,4-mannosyl-glycoprotein beta-1,4-N-acetylglucosaminyltransferase
MFRDEFDMLQCRLESMAGYDVAHVLVEAPFTHRGVPKPLHYEESGRTGGGIIPVVIDISAAAGWAYEHAQRNAAWPVIDAMADDADMVLICDLDEIPSPALLDWAQAPGYFKQPVIAVRMRTFLFAADWEVGPLTTCVAATARYLRLHGGDLAGVRDGRDGYLVFPDGGWHLSWLGGPERQKEKLETASLHQPEIDARPEGDMIRDGTRYRTSQDGGGLAVIPVDVDETWPRYVYERRCPANWFRPRESCRHSLVPPGALGTYAVGRCVKCGQYPQEREEAL